MERNKYVEITVNLNFGGQVIALEYWRDDDVVYYGDTPTLKTKFFLKNNDGIFVLI